MYTGGGAIHRRRVIAGMAAAAGSAWLITRAEAAYPDRPIKIIVPFPAGGGADVLARLVTGKAGEALGQQFVVENRPGAGGNIGTAAATKADPDGYTLVYGTNGTFGINHTLYKSTGFDPLKDFEPINRLTEIALVLVVHPSVPADSVAEFIAYAKANPGKLNYATAGNGTSSHLAGEMFKKAAGVEMQTVHYRGGAQAMTDIISGQVHAMIEVMPNAMPQVAAKTVKGLAVTTAQRWPLAPEIPTLSETALPGFSVTAWDALLAPRGTPPEVIATVNAAVIKILADAELRKALLERGAQPVPSTPGELRSFIVTELARWGEVVRASGARVE
jgi:tripartite-type tricarboxylate transporter receptor subunit TctC